MASKEAPDLFCADLSKRLQAVLDRDQQGPAAATNEHWWPFPDSVHKSELERHSRRPSMVRHDSSQPATVGKPCPRSLERPGFQMQRRMSLQHVWHDANQESSSLLEKSTSSSAPPPPIESHGFPKRFEDALQDAAHHHNKQKKQAPRMNRSRSQLWYQKLRIPS